MFQTLFQSAFFKKVRLPAFINNASLMNKIRVPILCFLLLSLGQISINYFSFTDFSNDVRYQNDVLVKALRLTLDADKDLYQAMVNERAIITLLGQGGEEKDIKKRTKKRLKDQKQAKTRFEGAIELMDDTQNTSDYNSFIEHYNKWKQAGDQALVLAKDGQFRQAMQLSLAADKDFSIARESLDLVGNRLIEQAKESRERTNTKIDVTLFLQLVLAGVLITFMLLTVFILPPFIAKPARLLRDSLLELTQGESDLTHRLQVTSKDELGQIANAYNLVMEKLYSSIKSVAETSESLKKSTEVLEEFSGRNRALSKEQHESITTIAAAVEEISTTVKDVADNADEVATSTKNISNSAQEGNKVIENATRKASTLADNMTSSVAVVSKLEEDATNIASVMAVISGIAEQTNLLALNAAIEAARAGEQGRGFAVVADEVRSLASRTQSSTEDIQAMINRLQSGVADAVASIEAGNAEAEATVEDVKTAQEAFHSILQSLELVNGMSQQIATATEQQSEGVHEISKNLAEIDEKSGQTSQNATQVNTEAKMSRECMENLTLVVKGFKL
ncbi:methyl-accepting chemotaxis protein [Marinomonas agarivorans]|nr:methyl-accepting chemotaxis protein [Marinomonas agarivorans]